MIIIIERNRPRPGAFHWIIAKIGMIKVICISIYKGHDCQKHPVYGDISAGMILPTMKRVGSH